MTWLHPLGLLGLASLPVLLVLSLWRWRRRELSVSSLLLWQQVAAAWHASPKSQRRRLVDPLVALRVATALALTGALCAPVLVRTGRLARQLVLVLDRSASMGMRRPDGLTRWEAARGELLAQLGRLDAADRVELVPVPAPADPPIPPELAPGEAVALLRRLEPSEEPLAPRGLAAAATAAARRRPHARVAVATDARLPELPDGVALLATGGSARNRGIVAFAARPRPDGRTEVLIAVANADAAPASAEVVLSDSKAYRQRLELPARGRGQAIFDVTPGASGGLAARLEGTDDLAVDDRAWLDRRLRPVRIALVGTPNYYLRRALSVQDGVEVLDFIEPPAEGGARGWDLAVYYKAVPKTADGPTVLVAPAESVGALRVGEAVAVGKAVRVADPDGRAERLMTGVDLADVRVGHARKLAAVPEGFAPLAVAGDVPLIGRWSNGSVPLLYVGIDPAASDWPLKPSFPIFWSNVVSWLLWTGGGTRGFSCVRPGQLCFVAPTEADATVTAPDGSRHTVAGTVFRPVKTGRYLVQARGGWVSHYAVSLLSEGETMAVGADVRLPADFLRGAEHGTRVAATWRLGGWLALLGLALVVAHGGLARRGRRI